MCVYVVILYEDTEHESADVRLKWPNIYQIYDKIRP